jgi:hypothetical protein
VSSKSLDNYRGNLLWELERIVACAADVGDELLGARPAASNANSLAGIASHALGAADLHVRGWALGYSIEDDATEFVEAATVAELQTRFTAVTERLRQAFDDLSGVDLEQSRETAGRGPQPVDAILLWAVLHAAEHAGTAELTRDLLLAPHSVTATELPPVVSEFVRRLREVLEDRLVGVYVGGSYSTAEFMRGSDYDIAVIISDELTDRDVARLRTLHESFARDDAQSLLLEGDYIAQHTLIPEGTTVPAWWFRRGTLREREFMMSADNIANLGRQGITAYGLPAAQVFPVVSPDQVRAAVRDMMAETPDLSSEGAAARELLDLARSLRALENGEPTSRAAGFAWALEHLDGRWHASLRRAAAVRAGAAVDSSDDRLRRAVGELRASLGLV